MAVVLDGLVYGLQLGLLAVGLTLLYGLGGVLNLAHGQLAVIAAISTALLLDAGLPAGVAAVIGILGVGMLGLILDRTLMVPVYRRRGGERVLLGLLLTLGAAFTIDGLLVWRYPVQALTLSIGGGGVDVLGVHMRSGSLLASAIAVAAGVALTGFLRFTRTGRAVRSVIQDEAGAQLVGIDTGAMRSLIMALSAMLAGIVAITQSMTVGVTATSGLGFTILALIVTVVGGLGSVSGALLAGVLLGIVNALSSFYIGAYLTSIILLTAAAGTIVLRPTGLLGRAP